MRMLAGVAMLLAGAVATAGEVYKWVDKDGRVHYGDRPKHEAQPVDIPTAVPAESEQPSGDEAARAAECERKKAQLNTYRNATAIKETDNLGRTKEYTAQEREQFLARTEQQVAEACAPPAAAPEG